MGTHSATGGPALVAAMRTKDMSRSDLARCLKRSATTIYDWTRGAPIHKRYHEALSSIFGEETTTAIYAERSTSVGSGRIGDRRKVLASALRIAKSEGDTALEDALVKAIERGAPERAK